MKKVKVMGKTDWFKTILFNLPTKSKTRSLRAIRKDLKKTERILAMQYGKGAPQNQKSGSPCTD